MLYHYLFIALISNGWLSKSVDHTRLCAQLAVRLADLKNNF